MRLNVSATNESGLCGRCRHSQVTRGDRVADHTIICTTCAVPRAVSFLVRSCNEFEELSKPTEYEMEKIAWVLEVRGKQVGFRPPKSGEEK